MHNVTILIKSETRERLKKIGIKSQTYDEIISELIDQKLGRKNAALVSNRPKIMQSENGTNSS
jgi:hypothetical protein